MFKLEAPFPGYQTTLILPSPNWGDSVEVAASVTTLRSMNGVAYTYVKQRGGRKRLHFDFEIARHKGLELRAFLKVYYASPIRLTDHDGTQWLTYLQNNPFELAGGTKAIPFPGGETMTVTLEFEETE